ncbi:MAG: GNAT family N-acetyltransferase [Rhodobacteraceae bacterium]|nr:GNAT family N-acetyltransferase [Paracoccaceae bacterium]
MSVELRPARSTDAGALGDILYRFQQDTEWMPELYTGAEFIAFAGAMIDWEWVTVAEVDGRVQGFIARDGEEICALYVSERANGRGVGRVLLGDAKRRSDRLRLRVLEANEWAQRFYQRQGFVESGRGDGAENDENMPDIVYVWTKEVLS